MKELILKYAIINAVEHEGRADVQAVLGKVIAEDVSLKTKIKEIIGEIKKTVKYVNSLSAEEQIKMFGELGVKIEKKKLEKYELPELPNAKIGKVITAFPPEPSKYPHLGHAKAALINFLYAKKYKGRFILRFEDSNPELAKKEFYKIILDGLKWLGIKWNKLDYLSNHLPQYYKATEKLLSSGKAYVCLCSQQAIKEKRIKGETCKHREQDIKTNLQLWRKMKKFKEGQATVRLKIDMQHPNTTLRDPSIMRIVDHTHPRTKKKYRLWPIYDFGTAMLDVWEKVTHRVRSKEFEMRKELQQFIQKSLGHSPPFIMEIGRFNMKGVPSSGRIIREMIKTKQLMGWDDPRLTTLVALKRRGFVPEAIRNFLVSIGVTKAEAVLEWDTLEAENRKVIDKLAHRYFSVLDPIKIEIRDQPKMRFVEAPMHPDFPKIKRKIPVNPKKIYIEKDDYEKFENQNVGLMYLSTINISKRAKFVSEKMKYEDPKIQWVSEPKVKMKIVMPDGTAKTAIGEINIKKLKKNEIIQLIRIGFCRVDKKGKDIVLYFAHK